LTELKNNASFKNTLFKDFIDFSETNFEKNANFYSANFKKPVDFLSIIFNGALNFVNAKTDFTYDELKNFIKDKSTNNIDKCINVTNDFRDGFRLMKYALNNKGNALDASLFHRLELYCKELELEFTLENAKAKDGGNSKEVKSADEIEVKSKSKNRIELFLDLITLKLYRNTSDHHTNLFKIINFTILSIAVYGLSFCILDDYLLKVMINSPKILMLLLLSIFLIGLLVCLLYLTMKYKIRWVTVPIGIVAYVSFITPGLVNAFDYSIYVIVFILLYVTLYALSFYLFRFSFVRFMTYLIFMAIFLDKPVLITPFIGIFTSEKIAESKFEEYIVKYNNNSLDDMLLDANFTNIKAENKINFIAKNRKIILERLDNSRTHTPLIDFVKKLYKDHLSDEEIDNLLRFDNKLKETFASKLSGGQRRLLSFVLSLIGKPSILFLDEPTAGMDTSTRIRFWEIVNTLKNDGLTIIYSSHYIEEVEHTADRILVLNKGELIRDTTPHAMRAEEVEKFFTLPIKFLEVIENNSEIYNLEIKRDSFNFLTKKTDLIWNTLQKSGCTLNDLEIQNRTLLDSIFNTTKEQ